MVMARSWSWQGHSHGRVTEPSRGATKSWTEFPCDVAQRANSAFGIEVRAERREGGGGGGGGGGIVSCPDHAIIHYADNAYLNVGLGTRLGRGRVCVCMCVCK